MKAVILAGGKGTRLLPYTTIIPKPLMPLGDMPILEILLHQLKYADVDEVILTVGHLATLFEAYFQDGAKYGMKIRYSLEDTPLGTAGPLSLVDGLEEAFFVLNGDVLTTLDFTTLAQDHAAQAALATIATHQRKVKIDFGVIQSNDGREVIGYTEKPAIDYQVSMGIYVFGPRILDYIPRGKYMDFPDLVLKLIAAGEKVLNHPFDGYWQDLGRPDDYAVANEQFRSLRAQILRESKE